MSRARLTRVVTGDADRRAPRPGKPLRCWRLADPDTALAAGTPAATPSTVSLVVQIAALLRQLLSTVPSLPLEAALVPVHPRASRPRPGRRAG
jgi:hypothetical protein